jgi:hypothetical protein
LSISNETGGNFEDNRCAQSLQAFWKSVPRASSPEDEAGPYF